ncbi:MAG TPA: agmatine deiminase family protein [Methanoregula sp.]|nr:agmatine deiminase family protein [Methanoregula sp.]
MEEKIVTIGLVQMTVGPDPDENVRRAAAKVEGAARNGAQIICLPELFRTRYFPQSIGTDISGCAESIPGPSTKPFEAIAKEHGVVVIVPLLQRAADGKIYNAAAVIDTEGTVLPPYHKVHIPQDPGFFEKDYFYPGAGYMVYATRFGRIAVLICFDQWFPEAARAVALAGAEIIVYPTAIGHPGEEEPAEGSWQEAWELIQRSHAIANSVHVAAVNRVGREQRIRFFGGSFVCDAFGKVLAHAADREEVLVAALDLSMNRAVRESWGFFRNRRPETYAKLCEPFPGGIFPPVRPGDTPRNRGFHMPAEWEPHAAVWLSWPHNRNTFADLRAVEDAYIGFIRAIHLSERVELLVPGAVLNRQVRARLREAGLDLSRITLHTVEYRDIWIRDYGPTFVLNRPMERLAMVRWEFNAWGNKYPAMVPDGKIPLILNRRLEQPVFAPGIVLEGGSIDVNGRGSVLTTRSCLLNPNRNPHLSADELEEYLREYLGVTNVLWLGDGIIGDDTDGHVDDLARFVGPSTVVCAYENNIADANYPALHDNYEILRQSADERGRPLSVVKLPMPAPVTSEGERLPASYTNFYIGNTVVVVPTFSDPRDAEAIAILQNLFPGRKVTGVDARALVEGYGTFHCATQQQPHV